MDERIADPWGPCTIDLWGHNVAETQTVLWMRMLDRRRGANPPAMLAVDPRATPVAREADVHLAVRSGTNLALINGRPTAQNTRETGADGDLPGLRNWDNEQHVRQLAERWNVEPDVIPHRAPPTPAMQIFRYAEQGSIKLLWISATNPAVSLPGRINPGDAARWAVAAVRPALLRGRAGRARPAALRAVHRHPRRWPRPAARPAGPVPDGRGVRHLLDRGRPGRPRRARP